MATMGETNQSRQPRGDAALRTESMMRVQALVQRHLAGSGAEVLLFGSMAEGSWHHGSDIDVAIDAARRLPSPVLADLRQALEDSTIPYHVEIVELIDAEPGFRERVRREGVRWTGWQKG
jgi:predicted nucleotidyltransferase